MIKQLKKHVVNMHANKTATDSSNFDSTLLEQLYIKIGVT